MNRGISRIELAAGVLIALLLLPLVALGQDTPEPSSSGVTFGMETTVLTKYVWRGFADYNGPSWQSTVDMTWKNVQLSWWTDVGSESRRTSTLREHNFDLHYSRSMRHNEVTAGYTAYCMLLGDQTAHEVYATVSRGEKLSGTLSIYQNIGWPNGTYISAGLNREFALKRGWKMELASTLGFNRKMYIDEVTFSDVTTTVTFSKVLSKALAVSPVLGVSKGLNRLYFGDHVYAGVTLRYVR